MLDLEKKKSFDPVKYFYQPASAPDIYTSSPKILALWWQDQVPKPAILHFSGLCT